MAEYTEEAVRARINKLQTEKGFTENGLAGGNIPTQKRLNRQLSTARLLLWILFCGSSRLTLRFRRIGYYADPAICTVVE